MFRKPAFFWCAAALGTALVLCYAVVGVEYWRHARESKEYGWFRQLHNGAWYVTSVDSTGPAAGVLRPRDRILAYEGYYGPDWVVNRIVALTPGGGSLRLTVQRGAEKLEVLVPVRRSRVPLDWAVLPMVIASFVCFAVAMLLGLTRPADRTVQYGCFTFLALGAILLMKSLLLMYWVLDDTGRYLAGLLSLADPLPLATGYLFASRFPRKPVVRPMWRAISLAVCIAVAIEWFVMLPEHVLLSLNLAGTVALASPLNVILRYTTKIHVDIWTAERLLICVAIAAVVIRNYRALTQPDLRRRIRWLFAGIFVGLIPMTILYLGVAADTLTGHGISIYAPWFLRTEYSCIAFIGGLPAICVAYGVLRHRLLDVHVVIRRSIQYLLAKRVLQAALLLPIAILLARVILNPQLTVRGLLFGNWFQLGMVVLATIGLVYRRALLSAVDRRFFREDYNQEQILRTLIEEVKERDSITEISRLVSEKLEAALHPQRILVFYRSEAKGDFTLGHSSSGLEPEMHVSADSDIVRLLEESSGPRDFPFSDSGAPSDDAEYFEKLGIRIVAPITGAARRLVGMLVLGEKRSESAYTGTDRDLLQSIAAQIGVVYDNVALRESARQEEQIKRNVLAHLDAASMDLLKECPRCGRCFDGPAERCSEDGSSLGLTLPVHRTIDGIYQLQQRVGSGAMGAVYRATDLRLGRTVALKIMVGSLFGNRSALRRFEREARAAARLNHPNIVAIHDFGAIGSDGGYLVMEMIEGRTLRAELRDCGALDPPVAARRFDQLLEGLSAAHAKAVVHRDLKPENLIVARLTNGGELVKILDFGLAKMLPGRDSETASLTVAGAVVGTMGYMSPEQLLGEEVDDRTDVFAVGVLAVECLTGRRPFVGLSFQELLHATLQGSAEIAGNDPAIVRLNAVLARCLASDRQLRPRVKDVRSQLVEAIRNCPPLAVERAAIAQESTIDATHRAD